MGKDMKDIQHNKYCKQYFKQIDGEWKETDLWVKTADGFHMLVPPNCIIMYDTEDTDGFILADGDNDTLNVIDRLPMLGDNKVDNTIGQATHNGILHGQSTPNTSIINPDLSITTFIETTEYTHPKPGYSGFSFGGQRTYTTDSKHTHMVPKHWHTDAGSNYPEVMKALVPTMYNDVIYNNAVMLSAQNLTEADWYSVINYAAYLYFARNADVINTPAHNHGTTVSYYDEAGTGLIIVTPTLETSTYRSNTGSNNGTTSQGGYFSHYHDVTHTMSDASVEPFAEKHATYKITKDIVYFDQLLSGTIVLCTSPYIPEGWSRYTPTKSHIYLSQYSDGYTGKMYHAHSKQTVKTGTPANGYSGNCSTGNSNWWVPASHTHTYVDEHKKELSDAATPPSVMLYAIVKD